MFELIGFGTNGWGAQLLHGALLTITLALVTLPFGLFLGLLVALAKNTESRVLRFFADTFTTVFRGLPELLTILIVYFAGQILINRLLGMLGYSERVEVSGFVAGVVALGLVLAAFSSEVWLGAIRAMSHGQREGAYALGISRFLTFRFVVLPQLIRVALPGLGNNWMALLKDTSLVSAIAVNELMYTTSRAVGYTKLPLMFYAVCCVLYLIMAIASGVGQSWLERRFNRGQIRARA